jgi:hypothetical protein
MTIQTSSGPENVMLVSTSRILRGATAVPAANLTSYTGQSVKVRYIDHNGQKEAQMVTVSAPTAVAKTETKAPTKSSRK